MRNRQTGQALVLVLLSLSVVLTLVLYILSRSVTDVAVSSRKEESVRAFSAAEAGIERTLVTGVGYLNETIGNAKYTTTVGEIAIGGPEFPFPNPISSGDSVTVWFVSHDEDGNLACPCFTGGSIDVCWGNPLSDPNLPTTPAIEITTYYKDSGNPLNIKVGRTANDPNSGRRGTYNSFDAPSNGSCQIGDTITYPFHKLITFSELGVNTNGLQFAQIKMFYNNIPHAIGVKVNGGTLPSQGKQIDSTGVAGESNRRVVVYQGWPEFPFASNTLVSPNGIIK